jgi:hypothetical protein
MTPHTTAADVATFTGQTFTVAQVTRLGVLIPLAERWVKYTAGVDFYDATDEDSDASQDWLLVVSLVAEAMLRSEDPAVRAAMMGPFQSEHLGDYSYTVKAGSSGFVAFFDGLAWEIIGRYRTASTLLGLVVNGPTRIAPAVVDYDVDVSRSTW